MRVTLFVLLSIVAACVDTGGPVSDADARIADAVAPATPDAGPVNSTCITVGAGSNPEGETCCVWDPHACAPGLACFWLGSTQSAGNCVAPNPTPAPLGGACDLYVDSCGAGATCLKNAHGPGGTCRALCRPQAGVCDAGQRCVVVSDEDNAVGACVPGGAA